MEMNIGNVGDGDEENIKRQSTAVTSTAPVTVVLKVDMHCQGCNQRIEKLARRLEGVETMISDPDSNKLTLVGFMDPVKIAEKLQKKSKKNVELISPKSNKTAKVTAKVNNDPKLDNHALFRAAVTTVVLKLSFHCDGCIKRIHKIVSKTKGVYLVTMDQEKELVRVTGTMDVKSMTENLKCKMKKSVQMLPEKNKNDNAEGNTRVGSPGLPDYTINYAFTPRPWPESISGPAPYGLTEGPITELPSDEDQNYCRII